VGKAIEIHLKTRNGHQAPLCDPERTYFVVAFEVNLAEIVFVQEIVAHNQPFPIVCKQERVRTRALSEIHRFDDL
jgi:hypothetical protein